MVFDALKPSGKVRTRGSQGNLSHRRSAVESTRLLQLADRRCEHGVLWHRAVLARETGLGHAGEGDAHERRGIAGREGASLLEGRERAARIPTRDGLVPFCQIAVLLRAVTSRESA